jgi:CRP/FNR family nitrogen fixation transcriptional regulator
MFVRQSSLRPTVSASRPPLDTLSGLSALVDCKRSLELYQHNQQIECTADLAEHWCCIVRGAARIQALLSDGRRRIIDFLMPGDFFGFRPRHQEFFVTETIVPDTMVSRYPRQYVERAADWNPALGRRMRDILLETIGRSQTRQLILGRITAREKLGSFLVDMEDRSFDPDQQAVVLPMTRYDIADYLAISVETVSRAFSELQRGGMIELDGTRRVRLVDRDTLKSGTMRRHPVFWSEARHRAGGVR